MLVLGIDFGGGSCKATLLNENGRVLATASNEYSTKYGADGLATQNPLDWYFSACQNIKSILGQGFNAKDINTICFSAATHTAVLLDENNQIVCDSIYWTDTRCQKEKRFLLENYKDVIFKKTKHIPDTIWTLPELMYLFKNNKEVFNKTKKVVFEKDFVRSKFTDDFVTDYIEAEGSMLFDFDKNEWDEELLSLCGLKKENMPKVVKPMDIVGVVSLKAAQDTGLKEGTKVICGSTDTAMEVFANGAINEGDMTIKFATAGRVCVVSSVISPDQNIINYSHLKEGLFYPGSATKSCAASITWFRNAFGRNYDYLSEISKKAPIGSEGLIFHPYLTGELTPLANPNIRGNFFGVSSCHKEEHFIRSVVEGISFSIYDCLIYLEEHGIKVGKTAYFLGGVSKNKFWMQIISDVLGVKLITTEANDSSFGGAMCAGISAGLFKSFDDAIKKCQVTTGEIYPDLANHEFYKKIFEKYKKISLILDEISNE